MAEGLFDKREIDVPCPKCGHKNRKALGWLRDHTQIICAGCGVEITLENEKLRSGLDQADKAMEEVRRTIRDFGKKR